MVKKEIYLIEGMSCTGCERTVSKVLGNLKGVKNAQADFNAASVEVEYDTDQTTIDDIKNSVNKVGYKFVGVKPSNGKKESNDQAIS